MRQIAVPLEIAIVDYGMGNLRSVHKALEHVGARAQVISSPRDLKAAGMILPGVGAFRDAMENLRKHGLIEPIMEHIASGKQFLGVCLGLHLLFTESEEFGLHPGLNVIPGRVVRFSPGKKVPHMGWNTIRMVKDDGILKGIPDGSSFYFVHSFYARPADEQWIGATTDYGEVFPSVISRGNIFATQFHPEKSQRNGLHVYENFLSLVREGRA